MLHMNVRSRESNFDLLNSLNARVIHSEKQSVPRALLTIRDPRTPVISPLIHEMITYLDSAVTFKALRFDHFLDHFLQILIVLIDLPGHLSVIVPIHSFIRGTCDRVMVGHQRHQA